MKSPEVSIIVPVYKVEDYLERCVKSILAQTYTDFELILVDDGSPDRCGEMCDVFAKEDPRIRVIHKKNGGLSDARNVGMDRARGQYLFFVDSDDYIHEQSIEKLHSLIKALIIALKQVIGRNALRKRLIYVRAYKLLKIC